MAFQCCSLELPNTTERKNTKNGDQGSLHASSTELGLRMLRKKVLKKVQKDFQRSDFFM